MQIVEQKLKMCFYFRLRFYKYRKLIKFSIFCKKQTFQAVQHIEQQSELKLDRNENW